MRVLFATTRGAGHLGPLVPLARACAGAGHRVLVTGPGSAAGLAGRAGLRFRAVPEPPAEQVAAAWAPVWRDPSSAPAADHVVRELFARLHAGTALPGMMRVMEDWRPDVLVHETCELASPIAAERHGVPRAQVGIHLQWSTDTDPRLRAMAAPVLDALRASVGLAPDPDGHGAGPGLIVTQVPRILGDPTAPEPDALMRVRAGEAGPGPAAAPDGAELEPLVYVSFGSEASAAPDLFPHLYRATAQALADRSVRLLMTIGDARDPAELGPLPPMVRAERWVSQDEVMPRAAAMVGHAGSGSTLTALAAGVPLVLMPLFVDGPPNARRVAALGAGIALEGRQQAVGRLAPAVDAVLGDPRYRDAAARVADEIRSLPPVDAAVDALAALAASA